MRSQAALLACALAAAAPAWGVMPEKQHLEDAKRFGLDAPFPAGQRRPTAAARRAVARFDAQAAGPVRARYGPQGEVAGLSGALSVPRPGGPEAAAAAFLREKAALLGIDPDTLTLEHVRKAGGIAHLLYRQTHQGLPVEFARLKMHVAESGEVLGLDSGWQAGIDVSPLPGVSEGRAADAVLRDLGTEPNGPGSLVYLPVHKTGELRLAWKFKATSKRAHWFYYIDARTGEVLFRYNDLRYQCQTSGTVTGMIHDVNASQPAQNRPMPNLNVHVFSNAISTFATTNAGGFFCSQTQGKIHASLHGPFASVGHFNLPGAHYDNGGGVWFTAATPVSSPHPYADGSAVPNSEVFLATIVSPLPPAAQFGTGAKVVKAIPRFSSFDVGAVSADGDVIDDDQLHVVDSAGTAVGSYVGNKPAFNGAAVCGLQPSIRLRITANPSGRHRGFDVDVSSFLVLTNNPTAPAADSSFVWTQAATSDAGLDEINVFYHLNRMHDYFMADINRSSAAPISNPIAAMVHAGPSLANAFYNPDQRNLFFGDVFAFALDASVVRHEYTHYVTDNIYPTLNFGQFGAISEGVADYFAASSLGDPAFGAGVAQGGAGSLRDLDSHGDCTLVPRGGRCKFFPTDWAGEIHDDSLPLSQALWDLRSDATVGAACADELAFQSLFFFPDSFQEFADALLQVSARVALAPSCGAASSKDAAILNALSLHGITAGAGGGDGYEPNDGAQSATDITTRTVIAATVYPIADIDTYAFGSGPGLIRATLDLPAGPSSPGSYFAYGMRLLDRRLQVVAQAYPPIDINGVDGVCPPGNAPAEYCLTSAQRVTLQYNGPAAEEYYLQVAGALNGEGGNSATNSAVPYALTVDYPRADAWAATIITAAYDNDAIRFSVVVSSFVRYQNFSFSHARLRDHAFTALAQTATNGAAPYLTLVSSVSAAGRITGVLRLARGFGARFPAVGTVYLEIFGVNRLQEAKRDGGDPYVAQTLGFSNAVHLTAAYSALTAYNNVFNPARGGKATFKYEITEPGRVTLKLYTLSGIHVATLADDDFPAGKGSLDWTGRNLSGTTVASGVYLLRLKAPGIDATQKVVVVK